FVNNVEPKNGYVKGVNGRLYSKDGMVAFCAGAGTKLVYQNNEIVKYLGYYSFQDEIILFAKCLKTTMSITEEEVCNDFIIANFFHVESFSDTISLTNEFSSNSEEMEVCETVPIENIDETDFENN